MDAALAELHERLGDSVLTDPATLENYRFDWARDPAAGTPLAVVRARDAAEVQQTVRWAAVHGVPVVPRGAGSGLSGGSSAVGGGIVLSLERMRAIEIDVATRVAVVEPGAFNAEVKVAAAEHGLWYPPDPSSYEICSIGGNIATNAGGLCCVKYGVTADYVLGLDVVLADGSLVTLGGKRVEDFRPMGLDRQAGAMLVIQSDAPGGARADEVSAAVTACERAGAKEVFATDDPDEGELFVQARRLHFTALESRGAVLPEDVGVPIPQLPALLAAVEEIAQRYAVQVPVVAHAGDGNTHPAIVYSAGDEDAEHRARLAFDAIMVAAIELGGTITGEHGVGRLKTASLQLQLGPEVMDLTRRVKAALDPHGILNPGAGF